MAGGCLSLFGLPFLLAGIFMSCLYFGSYIHWWRARSWEEIPCAIESTKLVESHGEKGGVSYHATARYRYRFAGRNYEGDRVLFGSGADNVGSFQEDTHRELTSYANAKSDHPFRCYVNPDKPEESVLYRDFRWEMSAFLSIFTLTFPAVGAGLVIGGLLGIRRKKQEDALISEYPDKRWRWKNTWNGTTVAEDSPHSQIALISYTAWFWLVVIPLITAMALTSTFQKGGWALLVLILPVLGLIPSIFAFRKIRHRMAVGKTWFELKEWPVNPGGSLHGSIVLARSLPSRGTAELTLECLKSITKTSGNGTTTNTEKVWSHPETVRLDLITRDLNGFRLPVGFHLPNAPETTVNSSDTIQYRWNLHLKVPGTPVHAVYEIPVFSSGQLLDQIPATSITLPQVSVSELPALLAARHITAEFDGADFPKSILCPPARHLGPLLFLTIFNLIWTAVAVFLVMKHAPLIFRLVWPFSAAAIWFAVLRMALHKRTVTFDSRGLEVRNQFGPILWTRSYTKQDVVGFSQDSNMTSGNRSFYRVRLESIIGKKETLADGITESATAAALAKQLQAWKKSQS